MQCSTLWLQASHSQPSHCSHIVTLKDLCCKCSAHVKHTNWARNLSLPSTHQPRLPSDILHMQGRLPEEPQLPEPDSPERGEVGVDPQDPPEADPFGLDALVPEQKKYDCPLPFTSPVTIAVVCCISCKQKELAAHVTLTITWVYVVSCCHNCLNVAKDVWLCCVVHLLLVGTPHLCGGRSKPTSCASLTQRSAGITTIVLYSDPEPMELPRGCIQLTSTDCHGATHCVFAQ